MPQLEEVFLFQGWVGCLFQVRLGDTLLAIPERGRLILGDGEFEAAWAINRVSSQLKNQ